MTLLNTNHNKNRNGNSHTSRNQDDIRFQQVFTTSTVHSIFWNCSSACLLGGYCISDCFNHPTSVKIFDRNQRLIESVDSLPINNQDQDDDDPNYLEKPLSLLDILKIIWRCALSALIINVTLIAVSGMITLMSTASEFSQNAQYIAAIGTFIGNEVCVLIRKHPSVKALLNIVLVRFWVFPILLVYTVGNWFRNDIVIYIILGLFAITGGYLNSLSYKLSTRGIHEKYHQRVSLLVNTALYLGVYLGIASSFILNRYIHTGKDEPMTCPADSLYAFLFNSYMEFNQFLKLIWFDLGKPFFFKSHSFSKRFSFVSERNSINFFFFFFF